jgi:NTP pyrophosphatase (non-canonical NTP hydrolase)
MNDSTKPTTAYADLRQSPAPKQVFEILACEINHIARHKGFWPDEKRPEELASEFIGAQPAFIDLRKSHSEITDLVYEARTTAPRNEGEMIALEMSELGELLEAVRHGNPPSEKIPGFSQAEEEMADLIIRCLDHAHGRGYRLAEAILAKIEVNRQRPTKHGKEF